MENTEIQIYRKISEASDPITQIEKMGVFLARSGAFGCSRDPQGQLLALICVSENKPPTQIMREWHVMEDGKMMPKTRHVHAQFMKAGGQIDWQLTGHEVEDPAKKVAKATFTFGGKSMTFSYSIADAKRGLLYSLKPGSAWQKNPESMLKARLITLGVDYFCPWLVQGDSADEDTGGATSQAPQIKIEVERKSETKVETKPEPAKVEPEIVEAQVVQETKPEPKAEPKAVEVPAGNTIPDELLAQVESAIGVDHASAALAWLRREGKIKPDQNLANISEPLARNIIKNTAKFIETINKVKV